MEQPQFHTANELNDLRMNADGRGIAIGEGNVLLCTIDGGIDWDGTGSAAADLIAADLADGTFYFCNVLGAQYRETNPATCDNELVAPSIAALNGTTDLAQLDADHGWLAAGGRIWYSDNGWTSSTAVANIGCPINTVALYGVNDTLVFSAGSDGKIHRVQRLGSTFICSERYNGTAALKDIDGQGSGVFAVGENGTVLESTDGGQSWAFLIGLGPADLRSVQVRNEAVYAAGGQRIYRLDRVFGGWVQQVLPGLIGGIRAVHMADANTGWAVGANGYIAATTNGGGAGDPILGGIGPFTGAAAGASLAWQIHPNPCRDAIRIVDAAAGSHWRLWSMDGRPMASGTLAQDGRIAWPANAAWTGLAVLELRGQGQRLLQRLP